jgi:hypothetical protein
VLKRRNIGIGHKNIKKLTLPACDRYDSGVGSPSLQQWQELLRDQEMRQMIDAPVLLMAFTCSPGKKAGLPDHVIKHKASF